jgi:hypothetical protein
MFRHLTRAQRAPLPFVIRAIRRHERARAGVIDSHELNHEIIQILHAFSWRKCDYVRALRARERDTKLLQAQLRKRTVYCFVRY